MRFFRKFVLNIIFERWSWIIKTDFFSLIIKRSCHIFTCFSKNRLKSIWKRSIFRSQKTDSLLLSLCWMLIILKRQINFINRYNLQFYQKNLWASKRLHFQRYENSLKKDINWLPDSRVWRFSNQINFCSWTFIY